MIKKMKKVENIDFSQMVKETIMNPPTGYYNLHMTIPSDFDSFISIGSLVSAAFARFGYTINGEIVHGEDTERIYCQYYSYDDEEVFNTITENFDSDTCEIKYVINSHSGLLIENLEMITSIINY